LKKIYGILTVFVLMAMLLISVGCQNETPFILEAQLTDNEKELLNAVVDRYFVFDVDLTQVNFQRLDYRVDHYEKGKLVDRLFQGSTSWDSSKKEKKRLIWAQKKAGTNQEEIWMVSFANSRASTQISLPDPILGMSWSPNHMIPIVHPEEEVVLAAIVGSKDGHITGANIIFDTEQNAAQALKPYDVAYLFTVVFHE